MASEELDYTYGRAPTTNTRGIPKAIFIEDVDGFMKGKQADAILKEMQESYGKYKFMEQNMVMTRNDIKSKIPNIKNCIDMTDMLKKKKEAEQNVEAHFSLSDNLHAKCSIENLDHVSLWLGANVMVEYTVEEASELLAKNYENATKKLEDVDNDLAFLRDQITTMEVNVARVYNWDVKERRKQRLTTEVAAK